MTDATAVHTYVFLLSFASAFLLGGKRPLLAASTRVLLVVLLALAVSYAISSAQSFHGYVGVATLIANVVFIGFVAIDVRRWQKRRSER